MAGYVYIQLKHEQQNQIKPSKEVQKERTTTINNLFQKRKTFPRLDAKLQAETHNNHHNKILFT